MVTSRFLLEATMSEYHFDLYSKIVSFCANVAVLGAVTLSMYMASFQPETHLSGFCTWFFVLLVPILGITWFGKRLLRKRYGKDPHEDDDQEANPCSVKPRRGLTGIRLAEKM
ncbi:MAG: hypothetical protein RRY29_09845 [Desulfovibrionaceae bacterium]